MWIQISLFEPANQLESDSILFKAAFQQPTWLNQVARSKDATSADNTTYVFET